MIFVNEDYPYPGRFIIETVWEYGLPKYEVVDKQEEKSLGTFSDLELAHWKIKKTKELAQKNKMY
jgi:hypothetical protein